MSGVGQRIRKPEQVDRAKRATPTSPPSKDIPRLQRALSEINRKIERGAENFLTAPPELTAELSAKLQSWKAERTALEEELHGLQEDDPKKSQQKKLCQLREELLVLPTVDVGLTIRKESFRQLMIDCGVRVDLWWQRASAQRWAVARVRLRIGMRDIEFSGVAPHHFTLSSLIV